MKPSRIWIGAALLYAAFFYWYTSFGGPLSEREIDHYMERLSTRAEPERLAIWLEFMRSDTGDDFAMLNSIDYRDEPLQVEGVQPGESSAQVLRRYTAPFMARAVLHAAHPIFIGDAAAPTMDVWGIEGAERWDFGGIVRYRSRRDLMEQVMFMLDSDIHAFKRAAMEKTIAFPIDPFFYAGDPRLLLALLLVIAALSLQLVTTRRAAGAG
jgi:hypothetical protein